MQTVAHFVGAKYYYTDNLYKKITILHDTNRNAETSRCTCMYMYILSIQTRQIGVKINT